MTPNLLDNDTCYQALRTHDTRFDGRFFVGVSSTKIYCRPVCPAKLPRQENCTFYISAAAAERDGYRPCLRCRPELAPGNARIDASDRLAARAASRIEDGALTNGGVTALAAELGTSDRHLRRVIEASFGVSPIELAQTNRLLLAKRLLTDTDLPVTTVAFAAGFRSLRRFNTLFVERYRLRPTDLRRSTSRLPMDTLRYELPFRSPFDWAGLLTFVDGHLVRGVEMIEGNTYRRTIRWGERSGYLSAVPVPDRNALRVELSTSLVPVMVPILARIKRLFDLDADPLAISAQLGPLAAAYPGLRVPGAFDGFEMVVRAILGQQVSVKAATTLAGRFAQSFGEPIVTPYPALSHLFPRPETVASLTVEAIVAQGIISARAKSIQSLAQAVTEGTLSLEPNGDIVETMTALKALPGIGEWTAQYVAMRALTWPDAFPHTDLGIMKALNETNPRRILERAEAWRPWRAYAVMHLWKSLEQQTGVNNANLL